MALERQEKRKKGKQTQTERKKERERERERNDRSKTNVYSVRKEINDPRVDRKEKLYDNHHVVEAHSSTARTESDSSLSQY